MKQNEDAELTKLYEENGLFAKIIDTPAEEAFRCGFRIKGDVPEDVKENAMDILDWIHWEEKATEAVKLSRLYGGSLIVMLINDGCGLEKPLKLEKIQSVDGLMVYDRSVVQSPRDEVDGDSCPTPEYYKVFSRYGTFTVHESRCLVFRNGKLTERSLNSNLWPWGIPEAYRIYGALAEAEVAHGAALRLLDKSISPVLRIRELSKMSDAQVLRRLDATQRRLLSWMLLPTRSLTERQPSLKALCFPTAWKLRKGQITQQKTGQGHWRPSGSCRRN